MDKQSFNELITSVGKVRIPKIQRDYAQGRDFASVREIRKNFIRDLMATIIGQGDPLELDFIYGSERDRAFEPLDGQQRITTLFLLHWFFGVDLSGADGESVLTYETRYTSKYFCNELVKHPSRRFIMGDRGGISPAQFIQRHSWFQWEWRYDPTVQSMLAVIDAIYDEFMRYGGDAALLEKGRERLASIKFNFLDLGQFDMSDELFVKMNARGKQLSDFDKVKSTLEEEIQIQGLDDRIEDSWRSLMDGDWADLFWQYYTRGRQIDAETPYGIIDAIEVNMKRFILRIISLHLFAKIADNDNPLKQSAYDLDEATLAQLLIDYNDYFAKLGLNGDIVDPTYRIDFPAIIRDINSLIYRADSSITAVSSLIDPDCYMDSPAYHNNRPQDYFAILCESDKIGNDFKVIYFCGLEYSKLFRAAGPVTRTWLDNYGRWMQFIRNLFKADNNHARLDNLSDLDEAFGSAKLLIQLLDKYVSTRQLNLCDDPIAVEAFISQLDPASWSRSNQGVSGSEDTSRGISPRNLQEEITKARLSHASADWRQAIAEIERNHYLWGQIDCLLSWSRRDDTYDLGRFRQYAHHLDAILNLDPKDPIIDQYYLALCLINPTFWQTDNRLYVFNKDRDNSLKRYLHRVDKVNDENGIAIKRFIDAWVTWDSTASITEFLDHVTHTTIPPADWLYAAQCQPSIFSESHDKRIYTDKDGFVVLARNKTTDGHCHDPILLNIDYSLRDRGVSTRYCDSKGENAHSVSFDTASGSYTIRRADAPQQYDILRDDSILQGSLTGYLVIDYILGLLSGQPTKNDAF